MWIAVIVLCALAFAAVLLYNRLVRARNLVNEAWSNIDVQLKRRADLIPNVVETVKGYSGHEITAFEEITRLRSEMTGIQSARERQSAENALTRQIKSLFAVAEAYPDLKASENFQHLQRSLVEVEDHIQYSRRYYNGTVRDYNILIQRFPNNLFAGPMGFSQRDFFEIEYATQREAPDVEFAGEAPK